MTMPLSSSNPPERTEFSHGKGRAPHPDSDYQSQRNLPWETAERNGGSKRGGFTGSMQLQAQHRTDPTRSDEVIEQMLYAKGNPDMFGPDRPIVEDKVRRAPNVYRQPKIRYGVDRQD